MWQERSAIAVVSLLILSGCDLRVEKQVPAQGNQKENILTAQFTNVDDAMSVLIDIDQSSELQWEASHYLRKHPATAIAKLQGLIEEKHPSWFIAMCTLTDIGGESVVRFYCDLLDKNRYEMDQNGKRKVYGRGTVNGCMKPHYFYGKAIVEQIGRLGNKTADTCLQRAWHDGDSAVQAAVPKARHDIGTLTLNDLVKLAGSDEKHRDLHCDALLAIAQDNIHKKTNTAIKTFEMICALPEAENPIRASAHVSLIQCYELKKDYAKALEHCDWVINNPEDQQFASRCKVRRPVLLFYQGKLTQDDLFDLAGKQNELYDRIAQLGRSCKYDTVRIFDRIIREAPPDSKYVMEAHYWKLEYFNNFNMPERARLQGQYILQNCRHDHVLKWVRRRLAKEEEIKEHNQRVQRPPSAPMSLDVRQQNE